jgi:hypothetical protein
MPRSLLSLMLVGFSLVLTSGCLFEDCFRVGLVLGAAIRESVKWMLDRNSTDGRDVYDASACGARRGSEGG